MKRKIFLLVKVIVLCGTIHQTSAQVTAEEFNNFIGRGIAAAPDFNDFTQQSLNAMKTRGFNHVRLRVKADQLYTSAHMDEIASIVDRILKAKLSTIISWVNNPAEEHATEEDKAEYAKWWSDVAKKFNGRSDSIGFNLITELSSGTPLREDMGIYNEWTQLAVDSIRAADSTRIIILASPTKGVGGLPHIAPSIYNGDNYMMAEWHVYASGANKRGGQKNWVGDGSTSDRSTLINDVNAALAFTASTGIHTYFGAWMPMTNKTGDLTQTEVENFSNFFLGTLSDAGIPWAVNALQQFYNEDKESWFEHKEIGGRYLHLSRIVDFLVTVGNFLWTDDSVGAAPSAVLGLSATTVDTSKINISWEDNSNNEDSYIIKHSTNNLNYINIDTLPANSVGYEATGLTANTTHHFRIVALNSVSISAFEHTSAITTDNSVAVRKVLNYRAPQIFMYPNPTTGLVNVSVNDADFSNGIIKVYNNNGALVETTTVDCENSIVEIDGKSGIYIVEVSYKNNVETITVVKE